MRSALRQPGYLQLDQVRPPKHCVWGYDRTLKVRNFRSTKVGNFQSQLTISRRQLAAGPPARAAHREESELGREGAADGCPVGPPRRWQPWTHRRRHNTDGHNASSQHAHFPHTFVRPGLNDDRYLVERFQSKVDGEIRPLRGNGASKKSRGKASREIVSLSTVQRMRPERDEIIICTGVNCTTLGVQYWDDRATGLFVNAKYR